MENENKSNVTVGSLEEILERNEEEGFPNFSPEGLERRQLKMVAGGDPYNMKTWTARYIAAQAIHSPEEFKEYLEGTAEELKEEAARKEEDYQTNGVDLSEEFSLVKRIGLLFKPKEKEETISYCEDEREREIRRMKEQSKVYSKMTELVDEIGEKFEDQSENIEAIYNTLQMNSHFSEHFNGVGDKTFENGEIRPYGEKICDLVEKFWRAGYQLPNTEQVS